jgi:FG-GAP repeat
MKSYPPWSGLVRGGALIALFLLLVAAKTDGVIISDGLLHTLGRAVGPTLAKFGLTRVLPNPTIELYDNTDALSASNNNGKAQAIPTGLTTADWNSIRAEHESQRHAVIASGSRYLARNPGQHWETKFDGAGFVIQPEKGDWRWGLELRSYGFPGHEQITDKARRTTAEGGRVIYERGENLREWFVNDQRGLEHGFTIAKRPERSGENKGPLQFVFSVLGNLRPIISGDETSVRFVNESGVATVTYAKLQVSDADGRSLPARFVAATEGVVLSVDESTARYPVTVDPIAQQAYLKASNTDAFDQFGSAVAISGNTVVVGALAEASAATGVNGNQNDNSLASGAAYVFVRNGATWTQQAYLKASNKSGSFGSAVAISGDTIVVGAYFEASAATGVNGNQTDQSKPFAGAAYVFVRNGTTWSQQAYLKASNTGENDNFAVSVAISGDTVIVGAEGEASAATGVNGNQSDNSVPFAGAAYVFVRSGTTWTQQAYLKASNTAGGNSFGYAVGISGNTALVGAVGNQGSGSAYVFVRNGTTWTQQAFLKASNAGSQDAFGRAVAISGNTAVIGARSEASAATGVNGNQSDNSASYAGAAYVFVRNGTTWTQQAYLKASNTDAQDQFGASVAISGDTVIIGADQEGSAATGINGNQSDDSLPFAGAAYVFLRSGTTWIQQAYLKASNTGPDLYGRSVAISGDTAVVGALAEESAAKGVNGNQSDNSASLAGAAYVFAGLPATAPVQNISTRTDVLTGTKVLIGGFIISGTGNAQLLVRGLGPTLTDVGVTGAMTDPTLDLRDGNQNQIATNDNWKSTQQAAIQATGKAPPHDSESAILQTLMPGNYTAILAGKNNTTGVGLVEVYDQSGTNPAQLSNISSRGFVGTGGNVMIGGFITSVAENRVVIRALGPTLTQFGVTGALGNPVLGLFDANGNTIASNDDWQQSPQASEIQSSGKAPPNAVEPAILSTRPLGNTTAIVSGKNGTTGVALVEVYRLP